MSRVWGESKKIKIRKREKERKRERKREGYPHEEPPPPRNSHGGEAAYSHEGVGESSQGSEGKKESKRIKNLN